MSMFDPPISISTAQYGFLGAMDQGVATTDDPTFGNLTITSFAANWTNAGRTVADMGILTTVDINGGTVDGAIIGGGAAAAGTFTDLIITSFAANWTNAGRTIADMGIVTTIDINGGTADAMVIGGAVVAAGSFAAIIGTTANLSDDFTMSDGVLDITNTATVGAHKITGRPTGNFALVVDHDTSVAGGSFGIHIDYSNITPNDTSHEFLRCEDSTSIKMTVRSNGGIANFQSNDADLSDITTKVKINLIESMWDTVKAFEIVEFQYKDQTTNNMNIGVVAQQVQSIDPRFVDDTDEDGLLRVFNKDMYFAMMKALQEAMKRIEELEKKHPK